MFANKFAPNANTAKKVEEIRLRTKKKHLDHVLDVSLRSPPYTTHNKVNIKIMQLLWHVITGEHFSLLFPGKFIPFHTP